MKFPFTSSCLRFAFRLPHGLFHIFLESCRSVFSFAIDLIEFVVGQATPLCFNGAFDLFPVSFYLIPIHDNPPKNPPSNKACRLRWSINEYIYVLMVYETFLDRVYNLIIVDKTSTQCPAKDSVRIMFLESGRRAGEKRLVIAPAPRYKNRTFRF